MKRLITEPFAGLFFVKSCPVRKREGKPPPAAVEDSEQARSHRENTHL
jgi:hypothetical protein